MEVVEGFSPHGYVPDYDRSGVTIAQGFDIGQHNAFELEYRLFTKDDKMDKRVIEKYLPYVQLQRGDADKALATLPVTITADEAARTIDAVKDYNVYKLKNKYTSITKGNFINLPAQAQTVLFSGAFQSWINPAVSSLTKSSTPAKSYAHQLTFSAHSFFALPFPSSAHLSDFGGLHNIFYSPHPVRKSSNFF